MRKRVKAPFRQVGHSHSLKIIQNAQLAQWEALLGTLAEGATGSKPAIVFFVFLANILSRTIRAIRRETEPRIYALTETQAAT